MLNFCINFQFESDYFFLLAENWIYSRFSCQFPNQKNLGGIRWTFGKAKLLGFDSTKKSFRVQMAKTCRNLGLPLMKGENCDKLKGKSVVKLSKLYSNLLFFHEILFIFTIQKVRWQNRTFESILCVRELLLNFAYFWQVPFPFFPVQFRCKRRKEGNNILQEKIPEPEQFFSMLTMPALFYK